MCSAFDLSLSLVAFIDCHIRVVAVNFDCHAQFGVFTASFHILAGCLTKIHRIPQFSMCRLLCKLVIILIG